MNNLGLGGFEMTEEQSQLAKDLVALGQKDERYFRWMPGMQLRARNYPTEGVVFSIHENGHLGVVTTASPRGVHPKLDVAVPHSDLRPDLTDPATAGCLEYILNELCEAKGLEVEYRRRAVRIWYERPACPAFVECVEMVTSLGACLGEAHAKAIIAIAEYEGAEP